MADEKSTSITTNDPTVARIFAATTLTEWALKTGRYSGPEDVAAMAAKVWPIIFTAIRDTSRG